MNAQLPILAAAACFGLLAFSVGYADSPPPRNDAQAATVAAAPPSTDAAKHAKRTACIKSAKTKKLVGAEKTSFIKSCSAAP
jgi:hypothetical protein